MLAARERRRESSALAAAAAGGRAGEPDARAPGSAAANGAAATTRDVQRFASNGTKETIVPIKFEPMPFSAVSLGRLNPTKNDGGGGDGVFGARLLADALEERAVAADAMSLTRSGALDRSVAERKAAFRNQGVEVVRDGTET